MSAQIDVNNFRTLGLEQLAIIASVFKPIVAESWFTQDLQKKQQFGAYVIRMFQQGMVDPENLSRLCLAAAKEKYAVPAGKIDRNSANEPQTSYV